MPAAPFSVKFATIVVPVANPAVLWFSLSVLIRLLHLSFFSSLQSAKWQLANLQSLFIKYFRLGCFVPPGLLHRRQVLPPPLLPPFSYVAGRRSSSSFCRKAFHGVKSSWLCSRQLPCRCGCRFRLLYKLVPYAHNDYIRARFSSDVRGIVSRSLNWPVPGRSLRPICISWTFCKL